MNSCEFMCFTCKAMYSTKGSLYRHLKKYQNSCCETIKKEPVAICYLCSATFTHKRGLPQHLRKVHKQRSKSSRIICPHDDCGENFVRFHLLHEHLAKSHQLEICCDEISFNSVADFDNWKEKLEQETLSMYTLQSAPKTLALGVVKKYFDCHRSYSYKRKGKNQRKLKSIGTNKVGVTCPSRIEATFQNSGVAVKFWKLHHGHSCELERITLTKSFKEKIANQIKEGMSLDHILYNIRDKNGTYEECERHLLITKKDLRNIKREFNVDNVKRHNNDLISVHLLVQKMQNLDDDCPVLYYKQEGEDVNDGSGLAEDDFALIIMTPFQIEQLKNFGHNNICIDGTHETNSYDIQLYTLLTIDDFQTGCPVAFCFSNRCDELLFRLFFETVRQTVGVINSSVFMSDDEPAFYNAWSSIMTEVKHRLLCSWHIDRHWRQNLSKINGIEKRAEVYKTLRALLQITNELEFSEMIVTVLHGLQTDEDTRSFATYFYSVYANRVESWANYFRLELGINANKYLETFHKKLKCVYSEGMKVKRLDKSVTMLMKVARDVMFERLDKLTKKTKSDIVDRVKKSHVCSENILKDTIKEVEKNTEWSIASSSEGVEYTIIKAEETCVTSCVSCSECNICIHTLKCSCLDNVVRTNICKHIHACARFYLNANTNEAMDLFSDQEQMEIEQLLEISNESTRILENSLTKKMNLILELYKKSSLKEDETKWLDNELNEIVIFLSNKEN